MEDPKFRIHLKHEKDGSIGVALTSFQAMLQGVTKTYLAERFNGYRILGTSMLTGKKDSKGTPIYGNDIIEFDKKEWGGENNIHKVTWDEEEACWCFGGGAVSDMGWRTVIGNKFENPDLWEKISKEDESE